MPQNPAAMTIETWSLDRVKPYERNPRKISEKAIDKVCTSLREYGWRQPLVVDPNGVLIVGHTRRLAALKLDWIYAPVHVAHDLTAKQIAAYRLMDNRSHEESEWDFSLISVELGDLQGLMDLELTGFDEHEISEYLNGPQFDPATEDEQGRLDEKKKVLCPECGHEFAP